LGQTSMGAKGFVEADVAELKGSVRGDVLLPNENGYDQARRVWNGMIDRRPSIIVRCGGASDVMKAVKFARKHTLTVSAKGGGHNVAGNAVCEGGMMIDLSKMKSVRVDPARSVARVEPGATWREFDLEAQAFGLATTGGLVSSTGVAGFTLGGGIGWLVRKYGLATDNLLSVDIVTAEGERVSASMDENPDLFWGVRGGGGNFGIVTSFEFQLHHVGPMILGGLVLHKAQDALALLKFHRDFLKSIPDELTTLVVFLTAPPLPFLPKEVVGTHLVAIAVCYSGQVEEGERILAPLKDFGHPVATVIHPMPYVVLQSLFDESAPAGIQNYWKSAYLADLDDGAIETMLAYGERIPSPLSAIHIHHLGGAMRRIGEDATAFSNRGGSFVLNIVSAWQDPKDDDKNTKWTRDLFQAMQKFAGSAYVNFLGEEGQERVRSAYGEAKYKKLAVLKKKYDPTNFFHLNQNIMAVA
jgi:FAD/FMN-containing dehydrogenase